VFYIIATVVLPHHPGSASSRLTHLYWFPVHRQIQYKIALLTYKSLSANQPPYLRNLLHMYQYLCDVSAQPVRIFYLFLSALISVNVLSVSPLLQFGMNYLPLCGAIRESNTLDTFKRRLKTHLTSQPPAT